jgi:hypothetical protein
MQKAGDIIVDILEINANTKNIKLSSFMNLKFLTTIPLIFSISMEWNLYKPPIQSFNICVNYNNHFAIHPNVFM